MKKRNFSISACLHNRKVMVVVSLVLAVCVWFAVISGPANTKERTLTLPISVDLSNTYAETIGLRLSGEVKAEVTVVVQGQWSVISRLTASDLRVRANVSSVQKAGQQDIPLTVEYNSEVVNYDIVSIYPDAVTITCDYWETKTVDVEADTSGLSVPEDSELQIGTPILDPTVTTDGTLTLSGPKTQLDRVEKVSARIRSKEELSDVRVFEAVLVALDRDGNEVDLEDCSFEGLETHSIHVTVPVWVSREIPLTYTVKNAPSGIDAESRISLSHSSVTLLGPADMLDRLSDIGNLGEVDFDTLTPDRIRREIKLDLPDSVQLVNGDTTIVMSIDLYDFYETEVTFVPSSTNVVYSGNVTGLTPSVQQRPITVTLVGSSSSLWAITADDLKLKVDLSAAAVNRAAPYAARFTVNGYEDVWVYYGENASGTSVYVSLS